MIIKEIFSLLILYIGVIIYIPYLLYKSKYKYIFLIYLANVDIIANILRINFNSYFNNLYNPNYNTILQYISYNLISLIALSGIFIYGINLKNKNKNDVVILLSMLIMSLITWTLPTQGIPYITNKIIDYIEKKNIKNYFNEYIFIDKVFISSITSITFLIVEYILLHTLIFGNKYLHSIYFNNIKFNF